MGTISGRWSYATTLLVGWAWFRLNIVECQHYFQYEMEVEGVSESPLYGCYHTILKLNAVRLRPIKAEQNKAMITFLTMGRLPAKIKTELPDRNCVVTFVKEQKSFEVLDDQVDIASSCGLP
uniref:AlNc14C131G6959 protein n=1 Tax=Albugo laibachii Nc14 TaxID=890382 RepID=F0WKA6_9STRA|nr:AlNc14C131G6959 [Albugo laibachii Nc14]CCA21865.1 AlNc14C136G7098 [Albugo laibachii Nc14]|eukprot:CCA21865.1 AlNc14C136G7098 [Albugo laibachii Nc14]